MPTRPLSDCSKISKDPALLWRKNDFLAYAVGHDQQAIMVRGKAPVLLPGFVADFIAGCDVFRPLEQHIAEHAGKYAWGSLEVEALRSWLPSAAENGAVVSSAEVLAAVASGVRPSPALSIQTIGIPTGGARADLVGRCIASFARNAATHGRMVRFLVSDGSADGGHRAALRRRAAEWVREHGVEIFYAGEEEKRQLAHELVRRGCDCEAVEFALFDPLDAGFTCGANRNAMLLHEAGRPFISVDDDVICELAAAPPSTHRLRLFSTCDPFTRWLFPDRQSALIHSGQVDADFLSTHEELLGKNVSEIGGPCDPSEVDLSLAGDEFLRRLWPGSGRVRASFSGHVGDPGIPTSTYFLFYEGENRVRLTASEEHYRSVLGARSVFALAPCPAIGDASSSPGMAMALDHRELLPPLFPVLHAEDFIYGAVLWLCDSRAFLAHSPVAVRHEPPPGKTILQPSDLNSENRSVVFEFAHLIRRFLLRFQRSESDGSEARMRQLGRSLQDLASQPLPDFTEAIRALILEQESARLDHLEQQLRDDTESPDFWREDLEAYLGHVRESLTYDDFDIPWDLKTGRTPDENRKFMRDLFHRYGHLLQEWPAIVAVAQQVNEEREWASKP